MPLKRSYLDNESNFVKLAVHGPILNTAESGTISIGDKRMDIHYRGEAAIVLMPGEGPMEICFQPGERVMIFDEREMFPLSLESNLGVKLYLENCIYRIRFGVPTRELYINDQWYKYGFDAQPIHILVNGQLHSIRILGGVPEICYELLNLDIGK